MSTLQDYRTRHYRTIKVFAQAYGCGATKASGILRGIYHETLSKGEVQHLANVLSISFLECADACDNTYAELKHYKGDAWKKSIHTHRGIWARWQWEELFIRDGKKAAQDGDWTEFRRKYIPHQESKRQTEERPNYAPQSCWAILGIPTSATPDEIKTAFRLKVKAASDGHGGYRGDMDKLVQAKEQALAFIMARRRS